MIASAALRTTDAAADTPPVVPHDSTVLRSVAAELNLLNDASSAFEDAMSRIIRAGAGEGAVIDAQVTDLLVQHMRELTRFVIGYLELAEGGHGDALVRSIDRVALSAMARRLAAACLAGPQAVPEPASIEFF